MAEYGIVLKLDDIKGNCVLKGYEDAILVEAVSFGSSSMRVGYGIKDRRISVDQSPITLEIAFGPWVAELQAACYISKNLKKAVLTQLAQQVDNKATAEATSLQQITLENPVVDSVTQGWTSGDGPRTVSISFNFEKILFNIHTKVADFTNRNFTAGAV